MQKIIILTSEGDNNMRKFWRETTVVEMDEKTTLLHFYAIENKVKQVYGGCCRGDIWVQKQEENLYIYAEKEKTLEKIRGDACKFIEQCKDKHELTTYESGENFYFAIRPKAQEAYLAGLRVKLENSGILNRCCCTIL